MANPSLSPLEGLGVGSSVSGNLHVTQGVETFIGQCQSGMAFSKSSFAGPVALTFPPIRIAVSIENRAAVARSLELSSMAGPSSLAGTPSTRLDISADQSNDWRYASESASPASPGFKILPLEDRIKTSSSSLSAPQSRTSAACRFSGGRSRAWTNTLFSIGKPTSRVPVPILRRLADSVVLQRIFECRRPATLADVVVYVMLRAQITGRRTEAAAGHRGRAAFGLAPCASCAPPDKHRSSAESRRNARNS